MDTLTVLLFVQNLHTTNNLRYFVPTGMDQSEPQSLSAANPLNTNHTKAEEEWNPDDKDTVEVSDDDRVEQELKFVNNTPKDPRSKANIISRILFM